MAIWGVVGVLAGALLVAAAVWRVVLPWLRRAGWWVRRPLVRAARADTTQEIHGPLRGPPVGG